MTDIESSVAIRINPVGIDEAPQASHPFPMRLLVGLTVVYALVLLAL